MIRDTRMGPDFPVTRLLWAVTVIECVVLAVSGAGLLFLPDVLVPLWPWPLAPYSARALGAVYLAVLVSALSLAIRPWWSPARLVVPMIAVFTVVVTVLSLVELGRFTNPLSTAGWVVLYVGVAANALGHLWLYRGRPRTVDSTLPGSIVGWALVAQVVLLGGYGVLLLVLGSGATRFWPWAIDDFHARIYSSAFLTPAVGAALLLGGATRRERFTLGLTQVASGVFAVVAVFLGQGYLRRIDWSLPGTWLWFGLCAFITGVGSALIAARRS